MKRPLIYSGALHLTVIILLLIGFYNPFERTRPTETPMMIEFVHVAEQSAAPMLAPEVIKEAEQLEPQNQHQRRHLLSQILNLRNRSPSPLLNHNQSRSP